MCGLPLKISVIIVNYNGLKYLKTCFDSIAKSSYPFEKMEAIMVDNKSGDGSIDFVKASYPWVNVLSLDTNYGFAMANNIGAKNAKGEYLVFLNNDAVVTPNWLNSLVDTMEKDSDIGIVGSKILFLDAPEKINSAGANITFNGVGYDIGFLDDDSEKYNAGGYKGCVCAAAMMVRRREFLDFGGFDEDYFIYLEDVDLCWRYWLSGKTVLYIPGSTVYHKSSGTSGESRHSPLKVFYGTRNSLFNVVKNFETHNILFPLFFSFFYNMIKFLYFLFRLEFNLATLIVKAYSSFLRLLPRTIAKRRDIQKNRRISDRYLFDHSLIVSFNSSFKEFLRLLKVRKGRSSIKDV
jgi:GT2 family glycosyltransferase